MHGIPSSGTMNQVRKNIKDSLYRTLFLDVGNTLISMNFGRAAEVLGHLGLSCDGESLRRAEAAARPLISAFLADISKKESMTAFNAYMQFMLQKLPSPALPPNGRLAEIAAKLARVLHSPGRADLLWNVVIPGTMEALENLCARGLQLVVVSNADGTVEKSLIELGLRDYFSVVVDSHVVGVEKPDPRIFQYALQKSEAAPGTTLHIGDLYHADIVGARNAGLDAVLLDPFDDWRDVDCMCVSDLLTLSRMF